MKKILFISWDGPQTSYMEGLFFPILQGVQERSDFEFHVLQFTWAEKNKLKIISDAAKKAGVHYDSVNILRKPLVSIGSFITILKGTKIIQDYLNEYEINVVMPRSTFPGMMVSRLKRNNLKIIFDADGLPLEERIDFGGFKRNNFMIKFLMKNELKIISQADVVLVRSRKAADYHLKKNPYLDPNIFYIIYNGRNPDLFRFNKKDYIEIRHELSMGSGKLLVYCGSLDGNKYLFNEMIQIFRAYRKQDENSKFLVLTASNQFKSRITSDLKDSVIFKSVSFKDVPKYLSAADVGIGIIRQLPSMKAVSAIKLGEYLLMGLPTIFSKNIGDSRKILQQTPNCFVYDESDTDIKNKTLDFILNNKKINHKEIRSVGLNYFSLNRSIESYLDALKSIS